jgi:hypothetical protein
MGTSKPNHCETLDCAERKPRVGRGVSSLNGMEKHLELRLGGKLGLILGGALGKALDDVLGELRAMNVDVHELPAS